MGSRDSVRRLDWGVGPRGPFTCPPSATVAGLEVAIVACLHPGLSPGGTRRCYDLGTLGESTGMRSQPRSSRRPTECGDPQPCARLGLGAPRR